ncbi:MAG: SpoIIE family protein phosphatase [Acidobacteriia bacterium]|nr:SpoIIE family protein phosphatase [Terriglobia bacterium]
MAAGSRRGSVGLEHTYVLRAVFQKLAVGVVVCDLDGHVVFFSPEAERILGVGSIPADLATGFASFGCYRPDMVTLYSQEELPLTRAMHGEEAPEELIFVKNLQHPAGLWIESRGTPLRDSSGTVCGAFVVFSDVSVPENLLRNKAGVEAFLTQVRDPRDPVEDRHELVSERFARFRTMFDQLARAVEQTADSIMITDSQGIIEYVNPAFEKITGFSAAEVLGRKPNVLKSGLQDAEFYRDLWSKLIAGESFQGTIINRKKSGELFWSEQTISPIKDQAGVTTHFVSVLKDLTALRKRQEQEFHMAFARELQQRHYNTRASLPGFDIAGAAYPADETGGDYFDFIPQPDGSLYIVIADIAGHGFGSALVMAEVRACLRAYATMAPDISSLLNCVNRSLTDDLGKDQFVTMFLGRIDPQKRSLEYASAGHGLGYLLRRSGDIGAVLASTVPPLGIFPDQQFYSGCAVPLEHGDIILLLTDGITESTGVDGVMFGTEGALDFIRCHQQQSTAGELVQGLYRAARTFAGAAPQLDDITSVICKVA